jgi:hypothetical protein
MSELARRGNCALSRRTKKVLSSAVTKSLDFIGKGADYQVYFEFSRCRPGRADSHPQRGQRKKVVSPSARRRAVKISVQVGIGRVAAACRALGLSRSSYYCSGRSSLESQRIRKEVLELSAPASSLWLSAHYGMMRRKALRSMGNAWRGFDEKKESR